MKLSELLSKPFKLKGGGILNLKGFSKRVIDTEIKGSGNGESGGNSGNDIINGIRLLKTNRSDVYLDVGTIFRKSVNIYDDKVSDIHYIAIQDPYNDNYVILIPFVCEPIDENSANIFLLNLLNKDYGVYDNNGFMEAMFIIEIYTDTEDHEVRFKEINNTGLDYYNIFGINPEINVDKTKEILSVYGDAIKDAFSINVKTIEKLIGYSQNTTPQEPEGS